MASLKAQIQLLKKQKEVLQENKLDMSSNSQQRESVGNEENIRANQDQERQQPFNAAKSMMIIDGLLC